MTSGGSVDDGQDDIREVGADEIERATTPGGEVRPPTLPEIGLSAFKWVLGITAASLLLLAGFAYASYPQLADIERIAGAAGAIEVHRELVGEWFVRVKDLGQLFILTPLLPLLAVILGYIFGRNR